MTKRRKYLTLRERWEIDGEMSGYMGSTQADQCNTCFRRAKDFSLRCEAFPEFATIPIEILEGSFDHSRRHPGDRGIRRLAGKPAWDPGTPPPKAPWEIDPDQS